MSNILPTLGSVFIVSLVSLIGITTVNINKTLTGKVSELLVSFAVGALLGDAFIHLIPESLEAFENKQIFSLLVIFGILLYFVLEKALRWRHCHHETSKEHVHPVAAMNILGDAVHNFFDGLLIAASFKVSTEVGFATAFAVFVHEIPQELGDFGVLVYAGWSTKKALTANFATALFALVGAISGLILSTNLDRFSSYIAPITAGGFIYIACSDLIPDLHQKECSDSKNILTQIIPLFAGVAVMFALLLIGK